jgi:hypothetical protein
MSSDRCLGSELRRGSKTGEGGSRSLAGRLREESRSGHFLRQHVGEQSEESDLDGLLPPLRSAEDRAERVNEAR